MPERNLGGAALHLKDVSDVLSLLVRHGYSVLFGVILLENLGLPLPGFALLIVAGALVGAGQLSPVLALLTAIVAALLGDLAWYALGRWRGRSVLGFLCRLSLNPDTCVGNAERFFLRHGMRTLLVAKFLPGVNTVAPPLLGALRARLVPFLGYDFAGTLTFASVCLGAGYLVGVEITYQAQAAVYGMGSLLGWGALGFGLVYIAWRLALRLRVRMALRTVGLTLVELRQRQDEGEHILVIDVRTPLAIKETPRVIAGAIRADLAEFDRLAEALPPNRLIVTYCV